MIPTMPVIYGPNNLAVHVCTTADPWASGSPFRAVHPEADLIYYGRESSGASVAVLVCRACGHRITERLEPGEVAGTPS